MYRRAADAALSPNKPGGLRWRVLFVDDEPKVLNGLKRM